MFPRRSNNNSVTRTSSSAPPQQAMNRLEFNPSVDSSPSPEMANVPPDAGSSAYGLNAPFTSTSPPASTIHPIIQSTPHQVLTQSREPQGLTVVQPFSRIPPHYFTALTVKLTSLFINNWVPRVLSSAEIQSYRQETHHRIQRIRDLEAQQNQMPPSKREPMLDHTLFMTRLDYRVTFSRIFRINDLPPEVLTHIFHHVVWSTTSPDNVLLWRLWLTWVCRHWRAVALSDPTLWNSILFRTLFNFEIPFLWLERTANAPLDIRINDTSEKPISLTQMQNLLIRLFHKISNIRTIIIVVQDWDPILVVLDAFRVVQEKRLPMILERFEMYRCGPSYVQLGSGYEPSFYRTPIPLFGGAAIPSLNYLTLSGLHIDWAHSVLTNLTTLDLRQIALEKSPTISQFRALLTNSPVLHKLFLDGAGPTWSGEGRGMKPIHIPSLRVLMLADFSVTYAVYVCSQIFAPNIVDLSLINFVEGDYSMFYDFIRSNMPLVKILYLHNVEFIPSSRTAISILKWLQSMPLLTYFHISHMKPEFLELFLYNSKTLKSLAISEEQTPEIPCPKLAFFQYEGMKTDPIIRWSHIRAQFGSPLRKIYIPVAFANQVSKEQYACLRATVRGVGGVQVLPSGFRPVEELYLLRKGISQ